jgi:hypothetical protein
LSPSSSNAGPTSLPSTLNCRVPNVGTSPGGVTFTIAVSTTGWPGAICTAELVSVVVVSARFTVWSTVVSLPLKWLSPR